MEERHAMPWITTGYAVASLPHACARACVHARHWPQGGPGGPRPGPSRLSASVFHHGWDHHSEKQRFPSVLRGGHRFPGGGGSPCGAPPGPRAAPWGPGRARSSPCVCPSCTRNVLIREWATLERRPVLIFRNRFFWQCIARWLAPKRAMVAGAP